MEYINFGLTVPAKALFLLTFFSSVLFKKKCHIKLDQWTKLGECHLYESVSLELC